jgi:hypothetical protein
VDYNLRVLELQPAAAVSVIETDIAADVGPSIETEGYLRAQAEAAAREAERQRQAQEQAERQAAEVRGAGAWLRSGPIWHLQCGCKNCRPQHHVPEPASTTLSTALLPCLLCRRWQLKKQQRQQSSSG